MRYFGLKRYDRRTSPKGTFFKAVCCLLKADKDAGSPLLRGLAQKLTGVSLEAPKRIITARRVT